MIYFTCSVCREALSAADEFAGKLMRCPKCMSAQTVPADAATAIPLAQPAGLAAGGASAESPRRPPPRLTVPSRNVSPGRRYGFSCAYCSSRLEAHESQAATEGQCPTCGSAIVIPFLDRYGRLIDPITKKIIKPDPHPVHAYAAAGVRAPQIVRMHDGSQHIQCYRCNTYSSITANNCRQCGMPFTMEGTTAEAAGSSNAYCVASLVLGIVGLFTFCVGITPALAIIFGLIGYNQVGPESEARGRGMAIAGMILGVIGALLAMLVWFR